MAKLTIPNINADYGSATSLNSAFDSIETAIENTLSRDGTAPNNMEVELDMSSNPINNLGAPQNATSAARLQDVTGTGTVNIGRTVFTDIASLRLSDPTADQNVVVEGYYAAGDGGGGDFYWDSTSTATDNNGTIIKVTAVTTGRWIRLYSGAINVKWFGAKGDGVTDDTTTIQEALTFGGVLDFVENEVYKITSTLNIVQSGNRIINGNGCKLDFTGTEIAYGFLCTQTANSELLEISGFEIDGNSILAQAIRVQSDFSITNILIHNNKILNLDNVSTARSTAGIQCSPISSITHIYNNFIYNVQRTQVNPGSVSSSGIVVTGASGSVTIENNVVSTIQSPSGDDDADGILIFSDNRLESPAERQLTDPVIRDNRIINCKGRWVKLQTSNCKVYGNYMSNVGIELITNFRGVDAQVGGVTVFDNTMRLSYSVGGGSAAFFGLQSKLTGFYENTYNIHDNTCFIEQATPYCFLISNTTGTGANAAYNIHNNNFRSIDNSYQIATFCKIGFDDENMDNCELKIENNSIPTGSGRILLFTDTVLVEDPVTGPLVSAFLAVTIRNNLNSIPNSNADIINSSDNIPYLQNFVFADNQGYDRSGLSLQGVDLQSLPEGNCFYYNTDGGAGGLINAPVGYNRNVTVETIGQLNVHLTHVNGANIAVFRKDTLAGYLHTSSTALTF